MAKALRFVGLKAGCDTLVHSLKDPTVHGYIFDEQTVALRREALALPLAVLVAMERRIAPSGRFGWGACSWPFGQA